MHKKFPCAILKEKCCNIFKKNVFTFKQEIFFIYTSFLHTHKNCIFEQFILLPCEAQEITLLQNSVCCAKYWVSFPRIIFALKLGLVHQSWHLNTFDATDINLFGGKIWIFLSFWNVSWFQYCIHKLHPFFKFISGLLQKFYFMILSSEVNDDGFFCVWF